MDPPQRDQASSIPPPNESGEDDEQDTARRRRLDPGTFGPGTSTNSSDTPTQSGLSLSSYQQTAFPTPGPFSPYSTESERQLGYQPMTTDTEEDRVFPIRSVVSVNPATSRQGTDEVFLPYSEGDARGIAGQRSGKPRSDSVAEVKRSETLPLTPGSSAAEWLQQQRRRTNTMGPYSAIQADAARQGSVAPLDLHLAGSDKDSEESGPLGGEVDASSVSSASRSQSYGDVPHVTSRFTHIETEDGYSVITGRDGVLQRCEDEPIHTPGAVQGFGVLLALREENDGRFAVRYVSENSEKMLGYSPRQLFRLKNFLDILTEEQQDNLLDHIDFIRDEDADPAVNGPEVFSLSVRPPNRKSAKLWCAIHINPAHPDLVICEFELDDDADYPLRPPDELTPDAPHDTLQANPTMEEIEESTEILSKPLRILRSARKRRGEQGAMQVFDIMSQVQEQLASARNLEEFLKVLVGIVKELTGFHRVMIYQFDSSFNGKVVTELVDTSHTMDLYKGLHFPASDIPRQARDLYKLNKVRLLYDRDLETARVVCRSKEDLDVPLDMSHAYLRAMSPIHLKYLANMAVRSSMSISINAFSELWGLIACHSYGNHGMRVSFPIRKMCRLVGDTASRNIERLSYASRLQARKLINTAPSDKNPSGYIIASSDDLLTLFDADFGLLSIKGETKIMGAIEQSQEALAMLEYLRMRRITSVLASQDVGVDFPDLQYPPGFQVIAGLLYVPLSVGGHDFIVFFRKGQIKEVKWAGNPYQKIIREGTAGYLEPRTSFKTWHEKVIGKCRDWNEEQVETAAILCLVYGKFIEVWRQKEAALQSSNLTRLLLANSAHEVRTPLNAIINYLEIALEGSLDQETRENLAKSHSASKSLIYVINDLLDLTKTEEGQNLITNEVFDLRACVQEATDPFQVDARRKEIDYSIIHHPGLPRFVHGDSRRIRQAISNVTANAITHTHNGGSVKVEIFVSDVSGRQATVEFVVADSGVGMSPQQLDALFRDLEQVSTEELEPNGSFERSGKLEDTRTLGLGLAVVARTVRNMDGQLRLKSKEGQGSRFVMQLPFHVPEEVPEASPESGQESSTAPITTPPAAARSSLPAAPEGEILLVDRLSTTNMVTGDKASLRSRKSGGSLGSHGSQKSDADRLIDAIQTPLSLETQGDYFKLPHEPEGSLSFTSFAKGGSASGRAGSASASRQHQSSPTRPRELGVAEVRDSKTPVRAIKIPDEYSEMPSSTSTGNKSRVLYELSQKAGSESDKSGGIGAENPLRVLIAEDDPINMRIMRKRLERAEHEVHHTVNGEDCATVYKEKPSIFDVVLMDMQMPMVDGLTATKMIRAYEKSSEHKSYSPLAALNGRVPIFAVSASLIEKELDTYVDAGFDGWILKPIDFKRLFTLLKGIHEQETRRECLYVPGEWERGGWFPRSRTDDVAGSDDMTPKAEDEQKKLSDSVAPAEPSISAGDEQSTPELTS